MEASPCYALKRSGASTISPSVESRMTELPNKTTKRDAKRKTEPTKPKSAPKRSHIDETPRSTQTSLLMRLSDDVLARMVSFVRIVDVALLTSTCTELHSMLGKSFWENVIITHCNTESWKISPKARHKVIKYVQAKFCRSCKTVVEQSRPIGRHNDLRGIVVCPACLTLPRFAEIGIQDAMRKYKLKRADLAHLRYRMVGTGRGPKKMLRVADVLEVVDSSERGSDN